MNIMDTKRACDAYYAMVTSDWHRTELLLKVMDALICGGRRRDQLEKLFADVDGSVIVKAASFKMQMTNGGGDDDSLSAVIARISD